MDRNVTVCQYADSDIGHMFYQFRTGVIRWNQLQCVLSEQLNFSYKDSKFKTNFVSKDKIMEQYFTAPSISYHNQESYGIT